LDFSFGVACLPPQRIRLGLRARRLGSHYLARAASTWLAPAIYPSIASIHSGTCTSSLRNVSAARSNCTPLARTSLVASLSD
jgi:hypothetical protein